ncbi:MAG: hypothetical protein HY898_06420 [Deltaproteobacteria bacterium]|nr:hypothetical protein [Deltaproteobacteria bacterium]
MFRSPSLFRLLVVACGLATLAPLAGHAGEPPKPDIKKQCVSSYGEAQRLRRDGKLREAREQLILCSQISCPASLRNECVPWLSQVEASMPSIVIDARDPKGRETSSVKLFVDGTLLAERADGRSIDIDPGEHSVRFQYEDKTIEDKIVVREGEKNRKLHADFSKVAAPPPAASSSAATPPPEPPPDEPKSGKKQPILAYALGGVGVLALGSFAIFGLSGKSKENDLTSNCAPNCAQGDVDTMRTRYLIADISLGVGVVSLGVATWLYLSHTKKANPPASAAWIDVSPAPGGGQLMLRGGF